eukprot:CAMPEP_0167776592 /NCGR_PEP_ID=MMETSP0111_2-20121227/3213_1 /TAXON_ID=91324 /ORGANISM="Lotharella globosa, Strain CCCM811" /LENGTH=427 /DNA_ID=CAMNT_0007666661 /DNA_START=217 /DNA_END=1500 /DNA_ORIENTATION=+
MADDGKKPSAEDFQRWRQHLRRYLVENKCNYDLVCSFDTIMNNIDRREKFQLLWELDFTSCLKPCLDYLTALDLTTLACCSSWLHVTLRGVTGGRIKKIVGGSGWKLPKQVILPYTQGKKEGIHKMKFCVDGNPDEAYHSQTVVNLRRALRSRGLPTKGRKTELVSRLKENDEARTIIPRTPRNLRYLWEREWLQPFYVDQWVDVKDTTENWLEAQIIDVDGEHVAIHYKGWKTKYDEWLDLSRGSPDWDRIARPLSRFHDHPEPHPRHKEFADWLQTGFMYKFTEPVIMVHDTTEKWVEASVIGYRTWYPNCAQVRVTYHGWDKKYDEWIDITSYRLAPQPAFPPAETLFAQAAAAQLAEEAADDGAVAEEADAAPSTGDTGAPSRRSARSDSRSAEEDDMLLRRWAEGIRDMQRPPQRTGVAVNY